MLFLPLSYVLECASCGVIYRSRQYWMGNQDPESGVVRSEVKHVWEGVSSPYLLVKAGKARKPRFRDTAQRGLRSVKTTPR